MGTWTRVWGTEFTWAVGNLPLVQLTSGQTLLRCHFGFRWIGVTSNDMDYSALANDFLAIGVVTQTLAHGSTPPNALTGADDAAPPLERWVWWETIGLTPTVMDTVHPGTMVWSSDVSRETNSSKGQVLASVPSGSHLGVYLTWAPWQTTGWQALGNTVGQAWASVLVN